MSKVFIVTCQDGVVSIHDSRTDAEKLIEYQITWDVENIGESQEYEIVEIDKYVNFMSTTGPTRIY